MPRSMQRCLQRIEIQLLSLPVFNFLEISLRDGGFRLKLTNIRCLNPRINAVRYVWNNIRTH